MLCPDTDQNWKWGQVARAMAMENRAKPIGTCYHNQNSFFGFSLKINWAIFCIKKSNGLEVLENWQAILNWKILNHSTVHVSPKESKQEEERGIKLPANQICL